MANAIFVQQLRDMGYEPVESSTNGVYFDYTIPVGQLVGKKVLLGFEVPQTFPLNCPTGPNFSEHLLPLNTNGGSHPLNGVHISTQHSPSLPANWQYWSRPFPEWNNTKRDVKSYLAHIRHLLETL